MACTRQGFYIDKLGGSQVEIHTGINFLYEGAKTSSCARSSREAGDYDDKELHLVYY